MERFGLDVSQEDLDAEIERIDNYCNKPIIIKDNGSSFHWVKFNGTELVVLFDWEYMCFVTAYYKSWVKKLPDGSYKLSIKPASKHIKRRDRMFSFAQKRNLKVRGDFTLKRTRGAN